MLGDFQVEWLEIWRELEGQHGDIQNAMLFFLRLNSISQISRTANANPFFWGVLNRTIPPYTFLI